MSRAWRAVGVVAALACFITVTSFDPAGTERADARHVFTSKVLVSRYQQKPVSWA